MDCLKDRRAEGDVEGGGFFSKLFEKKVSAAESSKANKLANNQLASTIDIERLGKNFLNFAGSDDLMDSEEFDQFTKASNITRQQAMSLWQLLDRDGSGQVSKAEFQSALANLQAARAWLRYCPDCIYNNVCAYCQECNANCTECSETAFCSNCWNDHPARHRANEGDEGESAQNARLGTSELLRTHLLINPLNWAYTSPFMAWIPVQQKAVLRQMLRAQQQKVADALQRAEEEEEAFLKQRGGMH